jgi:hypothetical protein
MLVLSSGGVEERCAQRNSTDGDQRGDRVTAYVKKAAVLLAVAAVTMFASTPAFATRQPWPDKARDWESMSLESIGMSTLALDDAFPGVALPVPISAGSLDGWAGDYVDIYQVYLPAGQTLYAYMNGEEGTDFDLLLFDSGVSGTLDESDFDKLIAGSWWGGDSESFGYTSGLTEVYYLAVIHADGPGGWYTLDVGFPTQPCLLTSAVASSALPYAGSTRLSGSLVDSSSAPIQSAKVDLWYKKDGGSWTYSRSTWTGADGSYEFTVKPTIKTTYGTEYMGDQEFVWSVAPDRVVGVKASVGTPVAPSTMYTSKGATIYGYLKPRHSAGSYPVRLYRWRWNGSSWVSYGYVKMKASNYSSYTKYSWFVKFSTKGRWRVRAVHEDSGHLKAQSSGYDYITVK